MLWIFGAGNKHTAKAIRPALKNECFELAHRLVHSLQGLAGTIGAVMNCLLNQTIHRSARDCWDYTE
jgi:hypothetical protein